ncbi:MAG: alpha/beta hydrolase [Pseudomonadota bacterium]
MSDAPTLPTMTIGDVRAMLAANPADPDAPLVAADMRASMAQTTTAFPPHPGVEMTDDTLGGVRARRFTPANAVPGRTLLYFHGGGYVIGSPESHQGLTSNIAHAMGATAYSMDYRMGPENPFPAAIEDGVAAYRGLLDAGVPPNQVIISGDSAGGGTSVATTLKAREQGLPMPAGLALLSPWVNLANTGWSYTARADADPMINQRNIDWFADTYLAGQDPAHPLASPINGNLSGLPPMLIQVGPDECLLSDAVTLAERAGAAQVDVTLEIWPGMIHVFQMFAPMLPEAQRAVDRIGAWAADRTA